MEYGYSLLDEALYKISQYPEQILNGVQVESLPGSLRHINRKSTEITFEYDYPEGKRTILHEYIDRILIHGDMLLNVFSVKELPSTMRCRG
jgi:hypothetical protein